MRAVTDGRLDLTAEVQRHLDLCLNCRACESACPSGVQYGKLIEPFRIHMGKTIPEARRLPFWQRLLLFSITPYPRRLLWALAPARFMQWSRLDWLLQKTGLLRLLPRGLRQLHEMLPRLKRHHGPLPQVLAAKGKRRARVALFVGCAADVFFPETTLNTAHVLQHNGCEVWIPPAQVCCGALHYHAAQEGPAQELAARNCAAFFPLTPHSSPARGEGGIDAVIVNAAGCGAMLKDYGHLLHKTPAATAGQALAARVRDVSEFLVELGPVRPDHPLKVKKAVYHDACHLCHGQQIRQQPRQLLEMIPDLKLLSLNESEICCGAAGSFNITEPEMAERLGERKASNIIDTGAEAVVTGNVGCLIQIGRYLRKQRADLWLAHPVDALWASYMGGSSQSPARDGP
jgi:glycolate oxidase iron-sulfur subunit